MSSEKPLANQILFFSEAGSFLCAPQINPYNLFHNAPIRAETKLAHQSKTLVKQTDAKDLCQQFKGEIMIEK